MSIILTYHLCDDTSEYDKEFVTFSELKEWLMGIGEEFFNWACLVDTDTGIEINSVADLYTFCSKL